MEKPETLSFSIDGEAKKAKIQGRGKNYGTYLRNIQKALGVTEPEIGRIK